MKTATYYAHIPHDNVNIVGDCIEVELRVVYSKTHYCLTIEEVDWDGNKYSVDENRLIDQWVNDNWSDIEYELGGMGFRD